MKRRRSRAYQEEETVELEELLETGNQRQRMESDAYEEEYREPDQEAYPDAYLEGYEDFYGEEYSEEHELADSEGRFHVAMGMFDLISIIVGIVVVLILASLLLTLFNWLRNDILHSALLLQSGLQ